MLIVVLILLTFIFIAAIVRDVLSARRIPLLTPSPPAQMNLPLLMVLIPARNEALRLGQCLAGLVAQDMRDLPVLVVDDGSTDGTAEVAQAWEAALPQLRVVHGAPLPPGWAGKCWACWQAAQAADTEWLLFLDADTAPQPGMVASLIAYATANRIDLLTLVPLWELKSFGERMLMPPFSGLIQAIYPLDRINDAHSPLALANGQCILIRRAVYFAVDGHRAVRDSVLEDVRIGQVVKQAGYRLRVVGGPDLMHVRMYTNLREVVDGLRKNAIAGFLAGGTLRSTWGGFRQALLALGPLVLIGSSAVLAVLNSSVAAPVLVFGIGLLALMLSYWGYVIHRMNRLHPIWALLYPIGTIYYFAIAAQALWSIVRGRGVTWKGRTYQG